MPSDSRVGTLHSYLVLAYNDEDNVALDVGFSYMAKAAGRLLGPCSPASFFRSPDLKDVYGDRPH
jgi:hypothetical protein